MMFTLAEKAGIMNVNKLMDEISSVQVAEWIAYYRIKKRKEDKITKSNAKHNVAPPKKHATFRPKAK